MKSPSEAVLQLPTGTVTFLFTDIVGSTPLWERKPEQMGEALQVHNTALRGAIEAHGGVVFKTVGDAFQAAFATAPQALRAAIEGQRALQAAPWNELGELKVRMGLHTGEAQLDPGGDEYAVSHTKNRIGRIHSAAHGGQILLSQETADLVKRSLPEGVTLKDLGEHHLKGMEWLEHLYQVCVPNLPQEFPPLATTINHPNNLPVQRTSFIGRKQELAAVHRLLASHRLVTLTGSGGTGKSRLSLQVASQLLDRFPNGVWQVELAPLADPGLIPKTVASTLNLPEIPGKTVTQALLDFLRPKRLLLILDNCEHLLEACAALADQLIRSCPEIVILASSREFLGVEGEVPYRVPPMSLPDARHSPSLEALCEYDAVHLFIERARLASPEFELLEANAAVLAQVVSRLDGIPLAIELAASRLRVLEIDQLAQRLDNTFRLLTGGSRSKLPRHQTLRACIDWSYNLLSDAERLTLLRLSIFSGSWTLEAAEVVCSSSMVNEIEKGLSTTIKFEDVLDLLNELIDKSLIYSIRGSGGSKRYTMLETIRQYAHEKLDDLNEANTTRDRHLAYYVELSRQAEPHLNGKGQVEWLNLLDEEQDNIRLALDWAIADDIEKGLQLATALHWFWYIRNYWIEGMGWLDRLLEVEARLVTDAAPDAGNQPRHQARSIIRGKALNATGSLKIYWSENEKAVPQLEEARDIFQVHGDLNQRDLAISLGHLAFIEKDLDRAIAGTMQALDLSRKEGDNFLIIWHLHTLANLNVAKGDLRQARANSEESLARSREFENLEREASSLALLGCIELILGNSLQATVLIREAQSCFDLLGSQIYSAVMLDLLAHVAMSQGDYMQAIQCSEVALAISIEMNSTVMMMNATSFLGWEAWALQDYDQAIRQCNKALAYARELRPSLAITAEYILGRVAISRGEYSQAIAYLKQLIWWLNEKNEPSRINFIWSQYGFKGMHYPTYEAIHALGVLANAQHQEQRAVILFGAQHTHCDWLKNSISLAERNEYEQALASARAALGEKAFTDAWAEGQAMTLEQAVALALEEPSG